MKDTEFSIQLFRICPFSAQLFLFTFGQFGADDYKEFAFLRVGKFRDRTEVIILEGINFIKLRDKPNIIVAVHWQVANLFIKKENRKKVIKYRGINK